MSIAAVPAYLGNDFKDTSPGMRFGLLLPIWTTREDQEHEVNKRAQARSREGQEIADKLQRHGMDAAIVALCSRERNPLPGLWDKNDFAIRNAWRSIEALNSADQERVKALAQRQAALSENVSDDCLVRLEATAVSPFTTGLGNEHPLENGFAFLNPYGLPYLPGSGVKGVLRQAARELATGDWGDTHGWDREQRYPLMQGDGERRRPVLDRAKNPVLLGMLDVFFGLESDDGDTEHLRGALTFWDVIPQIKGDSLMVEIMTPHQSHYYQNGDDPHESGQLTPISFLTVPPGSRFTFHVQCDLAHLHRIAPELATDSHWKSLLEAAFHHAFDWLGFGAKTSAGYGAMKPVQAGLSVTSEPANAAREEIWENALVKYDVSTRIMTARMGERMADKPEARAIFEGLGSRNRQDKSKSGCLNAGVKVRIKGETIELMDVLPPT